jgi:hypothetical protein
VQAGFDGTPAFVSHAGRAARREQKRNTLASSADSLIYNRGYFGSYYRGNIW